MDSLQLQTLIVGAVVPFVVSILKRWITLSKEQMSLLVVVICFIVASAFELFNGGFDWRDYLRKIVEVYGTSQIVYWTVLKTLELDVRIEGK